MDERLRISPEEAVALGIQSLNWEKYDEFPAGPEFVAEGDGESLPRLPEIKRAQDGTPLLYDLIARDGERLVGYPAFAYNSLDSSQHPGWIVKEKDEGGNQRSVRYSTYVVVAWKEQTAQQSQSSS